jgi:hypothetical protein
MNNEKYGEISSSSDGCQYRFTSVGKKGEIVKIVQYREYSPELPHIYNLGFGHLNDDGVSIDDTVNARNGDMEVVLSTVAYTIQDFTSKYPNRFVYLRGSNPVRTRTYQRGINRHYDELCEIYIIYGHVVSFNENGIEVENTQEEFIRNKNYYAFLVVRK